MHTKTSWFKTLTPQNKSVQTWIYLWPYRIMALDRTLCPGVLAVCARKLAFLPSVWEYLKSFICSLLGSSLYCKKHYNQVSLVQILHYMIKHELSLQTLLLVFSAIDWYRVLPKNDSKEVCKIEMLPILRIKTTLLDIDQQFWSRFPSTLIEQKTCK